MRGRWLAVVAFTVALPGAVALCEQKAILGEADGRPLCLADGLTVREETIQNVSSARSECDYVNRMLVEGLEARLSETLADLATAQEFLERFLRARALRPGQATAETCHVLFVGDSLTRQTFHAFACLLAEEGIVASECVADGSSISDPIGAYLRHHGQAYLEEYHLFKQNISGPHDQLTRQHFSLVWDWHRHGTQGRQNATAAPGASHAGHRSARSSLEWIWDRTSRNGLGYRKASEGSHTTVHLDFIWHAGGHGRTGPGWLGGEQYGLAHEPFDSMLRNISDCGVVIFNEGTHTKAPEELEENLENLLGRFNAIVEAHPRLLVLFRETYAQHFMDRGAEPAAIEKLTGTYESVENVSVHDVVCWQKATALKENFRIAVARRMVQRFPHIGFVPAFEETSLWGRLHTVQRRGNTDCTHYRCYSPVLWRRLLRSVINALPEAGPPGA